MDILESIIGQDILSVVLTFFTKDEQYYYCDEWELIEDHLYFCAKYNRLDVLQKMMHKMTNSGDVFTEDDMYVVTMEGNLNIAKFLHQNGCPFDTLCYFFAICNHRSLSWVKWLYENECPWGHVGDYFTGKCDKIGIQSMKNALSHNCLDIARYLYEKGVPIPNTDHINHPICDEICNFCSVNNEDSYVYKMVRGNINGISP